MSVINQMLKDLDQRQAHEQNVQSAVPVNVTNHSPKKLIFIVVAIVLVLNVVGLLFWQLYTENKHLKTISEQSNIAKAKPLVEQIDSSIKTQKTSDNASQLIAQVNQPTQTSVEETITEQKASSGLDTPKIITQSVSNTVNEKNTTGKKREVKLAEKAIEQPPIEVVKVAEPAPQLSISRKQLSPQQLAEKKYTQAQQAFDGNETAKAEKLFEDILLLTPNHIAARKKLAALWFARQDFQPAHNLLSQGISLMPNEYEFRLMKARIYLKQGQNEAAIKSLMPLESTQNIEYQRLLATTAQQTKQFDLSVKAYKTLTKLQTEQGRWWLGLGVAHDSLGDFNSAKAAYKLAMTKVGLSQNAQQFVRQRLVELGD